MEKERKPPGEASNVTSASSQTTKAEEVADERKGSVVSVPEDALVVNVTLKTNVSVGNAHGVTLNPPLSHKPDIEAILNITNNRRKTAEGGGGEDYEYDYSEPTLPPSLPNVR